MSARLGVLSLPTIMFADRPCTDGLSEQAGSSLKCHGAMQ
jgi:hypothetical protein